MGDYDSGADLDAREYESESTPVLDSGGVPLRSGARVFNFRVKDSGAREQFPSGMVRDVTTGKIRWDLTHDGPMPRRYAIHLTAGALKYNPRNWMQADSQEELDRFRESAYRHFMDWYDGVTDEDHASATWFNMNGAEYVEEVMIQPPMPDDEAPTGWFGDDGEGGVGPEDYHQGPPPHHKTANMSACSECEALR